jgi:hypothetical protein
MLGEKEKWAEGREDKGKGINVLVVQGVENMYAMT